MSAALGLYRLQQVDSQMDQIHARLNAIRETLENNEELRAANVALSKAEARHKDASSSLKQSEAEVEKQRIKIEQNEANLYSGNVQNPKELQDLQMDVASLKKHLGTLEERELEVMIQVEEAEKVLQSANEKTEQTRTRLKEQNTDLTNESEALNKDLQRLESERSAVISDIDEGSIKVYDQLRQKKRGVAVTSISENSCDACGSTVISSQQQGARSNSQLFYCSTCGRILYAG